MSTYRFYKPLPRKEFGPLPAGDYQFIVSDCDEPHEKNDKLILSVKLTIHPSGNTVWASPWSGTTKDGEKRDQIAEFLLSCNRAPRDGEEPDWREVIGARGKCKLKIEVAKLGALAGKEVNRVDYFYAPKQLGPQAQVKAAGGEEDQQDDLPY